MRLRYIIHKHEGPSNIEASIVKMRKYQVAYNKYIEKHGKHFTNALAEYASKMMVNANGHEHSWTAANVKRSLDNLDLTQIPNSCTLGDITYLANMYYADFFPDILKDEASCLKAAYKIVSDPDGYEGQAFIHWCVDLREKDITLDFEQFI